MARIRHGVTVKSVSFSEFCRDVPNIVRAVRQGKRLILTYRGKPVIRLEPIAARAAGEDDPFYKIAELAVADDRSLSNPEIDQVVYPLIR
jgi:prevent-host-death family protein